MDTLTRIEFPQVDTPCCPPTTVDTAETTPDIVGSSPRQSRVIMPLWQRLSPTCPTNPTKRGLVPAGYESGYREAALTSVNEDNPDSHTREIALHNLDLFAQRRDYRAFARLAESIDWSSHPPEKLTRATRQAMELNLYSLAANLAERGNQLYSEHQEVQRLVKVLAPPRVRKVPASHAKGLVASKQWIRDNAKKYRGEWIAVREGALLAHAPTLDQLTPLVSDNPSATIVIRVL